MAHRFIYVQGSECGSNYTLSNDDLSITFDPFSALSEEVYWKGTRIQYGNDGFSDIPAIMTRHVDENGQNDLITSVKVCGNGETVTIKYGLGFPDEPTSNRWIWNQKYYLNGNILVIENAVALLNINSLYEQEELGFNMAVQIFPGWPLYAAQSPNNTPSHAYIGSLEVALGDVPSWGYGLAATSGPTHTFDPGIQDLVETSTSSFRWWRTAFDIYGIFYHIGQYNVFSVGETNLHTNYISFGNNSSEALANLTALLTP